MSTQTQTVQPIALLSAPPTASPNAIPLPILSLTSTSSLPPAATFSITQTSVPSPLEASACLPENSNAERGIVSQVIDGDTIYVRLEDGKDYSLRYIGIDSPERGHLFFEEALKANADLVLNKEVILVKEVSDVDRYDRLLRYVVVGSVLVNQEMVRMGYATAATYPPDIACAETFASTEAEARVAQVGMWLPLPTSQPSADAIIIIEVNKAAEWVDIQNTGSNEIDLQGWRLVSERGNQGCYLRGMIKPGEVLRIWAMTAQGPGFSCSFPSNIWNNSQPDPAVLYNAQGVEVSRK